MDIQSLPKLLAFAGESYQYIYNYVYIYHISLMKWPHMLGVFSVLFVCLFCLFCLFCLSCLFCLFCFVLFCFGLVWFVLVCFGLVLFGFVCLFVCLFVCAKIHALYPHHCALHDTVKHTHCLAQAGLKYLAQVTDKKAD